MSSIQDFYKDRYAQLGQGPGPEAELTFQLRVRAALQAVGGSPRRILDFGCNVGAAAQILTEAGHDVVGVDISQSAITLAQARVPKARFELIDSESRIALPDESFDVCFCSEVIEHLFAVAEFIREIHRLLRPGGLFLLTTPYHGWIKNLIVITTNFDRHFSPHGGHIRFFSKRSLTECLHAGGFQVESITGLGRFWPVWKTMFVIARKRT
jgi:2-polyprenyl-3-methyl-5-hydroxy-6-metoxy-1,4-benzoquinol methylase